MYNLISKLNALITVLQKRTKDRGKHLWTTSAFREIFPSFWKDNIFIMWQSGLRVCELILREWTESIFIFIIINTKNEEIKVRQFHFQAKLEILHSSINIYIYKMNIFFSTKTNPTRLTDINLSSNKS